ncbi:UBX domain-containing protein 4 [Arctopsyche grandis]|uniref:UBX domain-containing protein 4 n=1 Tax=Arctopsyche grandis TaxID=121162 RepID=UPI00406D67D2
MRWYDGTIADAVKISKSKNAYFVVFVEGTDDKSKLMLTVLNQQDVSSRLNMEVFVCIKLKSTSDAYTQFSDIYKLVPFPSLFFIGDNGVPVEVVTSEKASSSSTLIPIIDNLMSKKGISAGAALSNPSSTTTQSAAKLATTSFLAAEQESTSKAADKVSPPTPNEPAKAKDQDEEFETVCEGDVCYKKPISKSSPDSDSGVVTPSTSPSTSSEAVDVMADEKPSTTPTMSMEEKMQRAKELLETKRQEKLQKEKEEEKAKELQRRSQGQGVTELKQWQQEQELKNLREERLKEKKENEQARARILQQIAQDRADRQAHFGTIPVETPKPEPAAPSTAPRPVDNNITKIQFKMADGTSHTTQISSDATLSELRQYARQNVQTSGTFTLSTMYPRQLLGGDKDSETLRALELCPSSVLLLLRGTVTASSSGSGSSPPVSNSGGFFGMISHLFWSLIVQPAQGAWFWISTFFTGNNRPPTSGSSDSSGDARAARRFPSDNESGPKRRRTAGAGTSSIRLEGNTYRLKDNDSDDENNTWNGNSTQQM